MRPSAGPAASRSRGRRAATTFALFLVGAAAGALLALAGLDAVPVSGATGTERFIILLALPFLYLFCIAAHEGGHLLAGLLVDFRPLLFIAGPLRVERTPDGISVGFNRSIALAGGIAASVPVGLHDLRRRALTMIAGGPTASLIFGVQCLAIWLATNRVLVRPDAPFLASFAGVALLFTGIGSLAIGIITLIPARTAGFYSDGARMLRLLRRDADTEGEVALLALSGLTLAGSRPRDWDPALVARAASVRDGGPFEVAGQHLAYLHALDRDDIGAARMYLAAAIELLPQMPAASRAAVLLAAAVFYAVYDDDLDRARACLHRAGARTLLTTPHQRLLAEAAIRLAQRDLDGAESLARAAQRRSEQAIDRGSAALDHTIAEYIVSAGNEVRRSPVPAVHRTPTPDG